MCLTTPSQFTGIPLKLICLHVAKFLLGLALRKKIAVDE